MQSIPQQSIIVQSPNVLATSTGNCGQTRRHGPIGGLPAPTRKRWKMAPSKTTALRCGFPWPGLHPSPRAFNTSPPITVSIL